jgi:hypothetical protein
LANVRAADQSPHSIVLTPQVYYDPWLQCSSGLTPRRLLFYHLDSRAAQGEIMVDHSAALIPQFLALGAPSVTLNTLADIAVVLAAGPLERRMQSSVLWRRRQRQASGAALIGLGGYVAAS